MTTNYTENGLIILPPNVLISKTFKKPSMITMDFTDIQIRKNSYFEDVMDELKSLFNFGRFKNSEEV